LSNQNLSQLNFKYVTTNKYTVLEFGITNTSFSKYSQQNYLALTASNLASSYISQYFMFDLCLSPIYNSSSFGTCIAGSVCCRVYFWSKSDKV